MKLKEICKDILTEEELALLPASFDTVGDILIFNDFPDGLGSKEKEIGAAIVDNLKAIEVVAKKTGKYHGEYRLPEIALLFGDRKKTIHKESNTQLKVAIEKVYFSTRTGTERKRIFELVQEGEEILVMFSGIGPLVCTIARNAHPKSIIGVEKNPAAHTLAVENVALNKITNATLINGDVLEEVPKLGMFDRILMPLPKNAEAFLEVALDHIKNDGIVHLYAFDSLENIDSMKEKIEKICTTNNKSVEFLDVVKCGQFSPEEYRLCFDLCIKNL